jgi:hypothetical protein
MLQKEPYESSRYKKIMKNVTDIEQLERPLGKFDHLGTESITIN